MGIHLVLLMPVVGTAAVVVALVGRHFVLALAAEQLVLLATVECQIVVGMAL
jgi:hypothetical protein